MVIEVSELDAGIGGGKPGGRFDGVVNKKRKKEDQRDGYGDG